MDFFKNVDTTLKKTLPLTKQSKYNAKCYWQDGGGDYIYLYTGKHKTYFTRKIWYAS